MRVSDTHDSLLFLVPLAVTLGIGVILLGGPANTLHAANAAMRDLVHQLITVISASF